MCWWVINYCRKKEKKENEEGCFSINFMKGVKLGLCFFLPEGLEGQEGLGAWVVCFGR